MSRRWNILAIVAPTTIALDQATKIWARRTLPTDFRGAGIPVPVIDGFWDWVLAYNTGASFSLFAGTGGSRVFLSILGIAITALIVWMIHKSDDRQVGLLVALSLMVGGAVGNLIDRVAFGKVTDFVLWRYRDHHWPVFNIADVALSVAVGLFLIVSIKDRKRPDAARSTST